MAYEFFGSFGNNPTYDSYARIQEQNAKYAGQQAAQAAKVAGLVGPGSPAPSAPSWVPPNPFAAPGAGGAGTAAATPGSSAFNPNPAPHGGVGVFGAVPGQLGLPDPYGDLSAHLPGLANLNAGASGVVQSQLSGELSPETQAAIQDAAARFGISSGMPGSGLVGYRTARDFGLTAMQLQQQGLQNYGPLIGAISSTQTLNPALQNEIASQNAINAAAPDPSQAGSYAKNLFDQYLATIGQNRGGGTTRVGGTGGGGGGQGSGTGIYAQPIISPSGRYGGGQYSDSTGYNDQGYPALGGGTGAFAAPQAPVAPSYGGGYQDYTGFGAGQPGLFEGAGNGAPTTSWGGPQWFNGPDVNQGYNDWNLPDPGLFNQGYDLNIPGLNFN